jgi:hypothetical protein
MLRAHEHRRDEDENEDRRALITNAGVTNELT